MKKLLLLSLLLANLYASAQQEYWERRSTGFLNTSTTIAQFSYADADNVWIYAADGSGGGAQYQQWGRSANGGETWTNGSINVGPSLGIGSVHAFSASTALISVFPDSTSAIGGIYKTTDSGITWVKQATAPFNTFSSSTGNIESFANFVYFWDSNNGMCSGDPAGGYFENYTTTDGGVSWVRVPSANIPTPLSGEYGYTHNFAVSGDILWYGTNKGRLFKSVDRGLNWTASQTPVTDMQNGNYDFRNATEGLLVGSDFTFYRSIDGGVTWNPEIPEGFYRNFNICYVPGTPNTWVCTGEDLNEGLRGSSFSIDGGVNWIDINEFDVLPVDGGGALEFYDATHGLASGFTASSTARGVWQWINDLEELRLSNAQFSSDKLFTLSPNPTSGKMTLSGANINQVQVIDILGKVVSNNSYSSIAEVTIDLSNVNSGIYLVKVTNDLGNTSVLKAIKE